MHNTALCLLLLTELFQGRGSGYTDKIDGFYLARLDECVQVTNAAEELGVSMSLAASLAYQESGFDETAVSSVGAVSSVQVIPRYVCPKGRIRNCDLVRSGLAWLKKLLATSKTPQAALCKYNMGPAKYAARGKCSKNSRSYARQILLRQKKLRVQMKHVSFDFMVDDKP